MTMTNPSVFNLVEWAELHTSGNRYITTEDKTNSIFSRVADFNFQYVYSLGIAQFFKECETVDSLDKLFDIIKEILESNTRFNIVYMSLKNFSIFRLKVKKFGYNFVNVYDINDHRKFYGYISAEKCRGTHGIAIFVNRMCKNNIYMKKDLS